MKVNVHEAKTQLSRLLKRVADGDEVIISRAGVPVAKLVPAGPEGKLRPMGMDRHVIWMAEDFDAPDPELEALFYGDSTAAKRNTPQRAANPSPKKGKKKA